MTAQPNAPFFPGGDLKTRLHFHRPAAKALASLVTSPWSLVVSAGGLHRITRAGVLDDIPPPTAITIVPNGLVRLSTLDDAWMPGPAPTVGIGSGSVLDAAKLVRLGNTWKTFPEDVEDRDTSADIPAPLILLPTTAGSGSELTSTASLWNGGIKSSLDGPALFPSDAVYDPALLTTASAEIRAAALWDAITHALEAIWSRSATEASDRYASFALNSISGALRRERGVTDAVLPDLSVASAAAGAAITITRTGIAHALSYPLTGRFGLRHGFAAGLYGLAVAGLLPEISPRRSAYLTRIFHAPPDAVLRAFWRESGAADFVLRYLTPDMLKTCSDMTLNPDRANLSVIAPKREVVVELQRRAADLVAGTVTS